ncbi:hypothetical protein ES703_81253 [subsurface metagenome]
MQCRKPIVAGQFYPAQKDSCVDEINQYLNERRLSLTAWRNKYGNYFCAGE